jgi:hypothetical protein
MEFVGEPPTPQGNVIIQASGSYYDFLDSKKKS